MGLALIVPDISFAGSNIGQVTPVSPSTNPLTALAITGADSIIAPTLTGQYAVSYTPVNTSQRGVTWSLTAGGTIASIDSNGLVTITGNGSITIRATSTANSSIYAEKTISVQAIAYTPLEDLTDRLNFPAGGGYYVTDIILAAGDYIKMKFAKTSASNALAFVCGSRQLSNADDDTTSVEMDTSAKLHIKLFGTKYSSQNSLVRNTRYTITAKESGIACSPSLGTFTPTTYAFTQGYPLCIDGILYADDSVGYNGGSGDFFGLEIYGEDDTLKHRLIPQSDLTILDMVTNHSYAKTGGGEVLFGQD